MRYLEIVAWASGVALALYLLDRLGLWMERHGWIYYRKSRGMTTRAGNAFLELHSMLEPEKKHVAEIKQTQRKTQVPSGEPPTPGQSGP
jgi:hypothetical protein